MRGSGGHNHMPTMWLTKFYKKNSSKLNVLFVSEPTCGMVFLATYIRSTKFMFTDST